MDTYKVSAKGIDRHGDEGVLSITVHERSSEVIPEGEKLLMLLSAAESHGVHLQPPMTVELVS